MTAPDTFAMLTLRGKMAQQFEPQDERVRWNQNVMIPISLRKDADRDVKPADQYGREKCQE